MVTTKFKGTGCGNPGDVAAIGTAILKAEADHDADKEHFWIIGLTTRNSVKYVDLVSLGTLNASLVHPREVFRFAVMQGVCSIIIMHNHPSGNAEPSDEDIKLTRRLVEAGKILGIEPLDHVITTIDGYFWSFKEKGLL